MNLTFIIGISLAVLAPLAGCSSDGITTEHAKAQAITFVPGVADEVEPHAEDGIDMWEVKVKVSNGATVEVLLVRADGSLFEVEDKVGPFTYELPAPISGVLTFNQAKAKALEVRSGDLVAWNIEKKDTGYRFEFYVRDPNGQLWEVKLAATTGELQDVEPKTAVD